MPQHIGLGCFRFREFAFDFQLLDDDVIAEIQGVGDELAVGRLHGDVEVDYVASPAVGDVVLEGRGGAGASLEVADELELDAVVDEDH